MNGGISAEMKVVAEDGHWNSYLTRKTSSSIGGHGSCDSTFHKLIATLNPILVNKLLHGIAFIKPSITPATFRLTPIQLITELRDSAKVPIKHAPDFAKLITQKIIDYVIKKATINIAPMDDYEYSEVLIINVKNDTINLNTRNVCPTKQPWTINNRLTYDMAINNFVVAAMGKEDMPNKNTLSINSLKESIYKYVDEHNIGDPIGRFKWEHYYPGNLKLLKSHFTIYEGLMTGDVYRCTLKTKTMPSNTVFEANINMMLKKDIDMVINYATLIDNYFRSNNFVLKYYSNRPKTQFDFSYSTGQSPYHSLTYLGKKLPEMAKIDSSQTISFWIAGDDESSYWTIFPDGKALLTYHSVTTPDGKTAPIYPPQDPNASWFTNTNTYYLFDETGKVLSKGVGF